MRTRLFVSSALALMILVPAGAGAVGVGKQCGGFPGIQCNSGLFCQHPTGACFIFDIAGTCARVPPVLPPDLSAGLRLQRQDLSQRLRAPGGHGLQSA